MPKLSLLISDNSTPKRKLGSIGYAMMLFFTIQSQVESQTAATSSSSSSEQTVESTPTPDDHVTSPSPSPDDNDDGAAGGRGSDAREPEDNQDEEEKDKTQDSKNDDKNSGMIKHVVVAYRELNLNLYNELRDNYMHVCTLMFRRKW